MSDTLKAELENALVEAEYIFEKYGNPNPMNDSKFHEYSFNLTARIKNALKLIG